MDQAQEQVSVPSHSANLSQALQKLIIAVVQAHKAGGGVVPELSADVQAAIQDMGPVLGEVGLIGSEAKADPVGVAEAFVVAAMESAKQLLK